MSSKEGKREKVVVRLLSSEKFFTTLYLRLQSSPTLGA